jgi:hypothetical protein
MSSLPIVEVDAFPSELAPMVSLVATKLRAGQLCPPKVEFKVSMGSETLTIPYRVYYDKDELRKLTQHPEAGAIALALGTRHYDGFLREACVRELMARDVAWSAPFIFQLLGEYVEEIALAIEQSMTPPVQGRLISFIQANAPYVETTARRATSYWKTYYWQSYASLKDYPAFRVISSLCMEAGRPIEEALRRASRRKKSRAASVGGDTA